MRETLTADRTAPFRSRRAAERWARDAGRGRCPELLVVVSELVANSVKHGPDGGRIHLSLTDEPGGVRIEVRDEGRPQAIARRPPRDDGAYAGGRGLLLVEALSASWGSSPTPQLVWAVVALD